MGHLGELSSLSALLDAERAVDGVARVRKAEDDAAIRALGGNPDKIPEGEEGEMRQIVFGDYHQTVPPPVQPSQSGLPKALLTAAALLGGPVGLAVGIGGAWLLNRAEEPASVAPVAPQPGKTTTIERDYEIGPVKVEPPSLFDLQEP
jgi:hypothetical protein